MSDFGPRTRMPKSSPVAEAALADLAASGITEEEDVLQFMGQTFGAGRLDTLTGIKRSVGAYEIPYWNVAGEAINFRRLKLLGVDPVNEGRGRGLVAADGGEVEIKSKMKYWQAKGSDIHAYFPKCIDWQTVIADTSHEIWITEGEKKSYCTGKYLRIPTIGLGGVDSWQSKKKGILLIDDLDQIEWMGRSVVIIYDSDSATNPNVAQARLRLADCLHGLGAVPTCIDLPSLADDEKCGLDDFIMHHGVSKAGSILREQERVPLHGYKVLEKMNRVYANIRSLNRIMCMPKGDWSKVTWANAILMSHGYFKLDAAPFKMQLPADANGKIVPPQPACKHWWEWKGRREYSALVYEPGKPREVAMGAQGLCLNLWTPPDIVPLAGTLADIKPYLELRNFLFSDVDERTVEWFEQWVAYPLQNPGAKLLSAVLMQSPHQGTGKTLLGLTIGKLYGNNFGVVEHGNLFANFNAWAQNKQFVLGDEVFSSDRRKDTDALKSLVTRQTIEINRKNVPQYTVRDTINYFLTSNHPDALYLEKSDRRFLVVSSKKPPLAPSFYTAYDKWLQADGARHLLDYFLNRVACDQFNPNAAPPYTRAKKEMRDEVASTWESVAEALIEHTDDFLDALPLAPPPTMDWFSAKDIVEMRDGEINTSNRSDQPSKSLAKALSRLGDIPCFTPTWQNGRLYCLRNVDKWFKGGKLVADAADIQANYFAGKNRPATAQLKNKIHMLNLEDPQRPMAQKVVANEANVIRSKVG